MKKLFLLLFIFLFPVFCYPYQFPDKKFIPYEPYDIQGFFVKHNCFLATYKIGNMLPADIIRKICFANDINPRWILARMQTERCLITGKIKDDRFIIPGHNKNLKIVLRECCGYGLSWYYNGYKLNPMQYVGFINQISHCAAFMGKNLRTIGIYKTLELYDPTKEKYDGVELFCNVWTFLWPKDK